MFPFLSLLYSRHIKLVRGHPVSNVCQFFSEQVRTDVEGNLKLKKKWNCLHLKNTTDMMYSIWLWTKIGFFSGTEQYRKYRWLDIWVPKYRWHRFSGKYRTLVVLFQASEELQNFMMKMSYIYTQPFYRFSANCTFDAEGGGVTLLPWYMIVCCNARRMYSIFFSTCVVVLSSNKRIYTLIRPRTSKKIVPMRTATVYCMLCI